VADTPCRIEVRVVRLGPGNVLGRRRAVFLALRVADLIAEPLLGAAVLKNGTLSGARSACSEEKMMSLAMALPCSEVQDFQFVKVQWPVIWVNAKPLHPRHAEAYQVLMDWAFTAPRQP